MSADLAFRRFFPIPSSARRGSLHLKGGTHTVVYAEQPRTTNSVPTRRKYLHTSLCQGLSPVSAGGSLSGSFGHPATWPALHATLSCRAGTSLSCDVVASRWAPLCPSLSFLVLVPLASSRERAHKRSNFMTFHLYFTRHLDLLDKEF